MDEDEPGVDQVEALAGWFFRPHVVHAHLDRRPAGRGDPRGVDVRREDPAGRPHPLGQPRRHGGSSGSDLPAAPAGADAECLQVPERRGIEERGEGVEALRRLGLPVVEEVSVGSRHAAIIPVVPLARWGRRSGTRATSATAGPVRDGACGRPSGPSTGGNKAESPVSTGPFALSAGLANWPAKARETQREGTHAGRFG